MEERYVSKSGVEIYGYKNSASHGFFISFFIRAGSMFESDEESGITHFFEHVAIRNVNRRMGGKLYSELDRLGIEFNASTFYEMVQFYVSGAASNFSEGARVITELLSPIALSKAEIDSERKRIKAEIREADEKSSLQAFSSGIVYQGTNLARGIAGTLTSVDRITARRLEEYRKRVAASNNIFFYVTGSYTPEDIKSLSDCIDAHSPQKGKRNENIAPVSILFASRPREVFIKNADYMSVRFTFDIDVGEVCMPASDLLYDILLSGYNSRFFIEMSEHRGLFYDISGAVERYKNTGELWFSYELRERELYSAVEITVALLREFKERLLLEGELMKAGYTENAELLLDDIRELNFTFAYDNHIMDLGYESVTERSMAYKKVTPEDIKSAACRVFSPNNLTLAIKGNKKRIDSERLLEIISKL